MTNPQKFSPAASPDKLYYTRYDLQAALMSSPGFSTLQEPSKDSSIERILLFIEIERLNNVCYTLQQEVEHLRKQALTSSINSPETMEEKIKALLLENQNLHIINDNLVKELELAQQKDATAPELQQKISFLLSENEKLQKIAATHAETATILRSQLIAMQGDVHSAHDAGKTIEALNYRVDELNSLLIQKSQELTESKSELHKIITNQLSISGENAKLKATVTELQHQLQLWQERAIDSDKHALAAKDLELRHSKLQKDFEQMKSHIELLNKEIESLHDQNIQLKEESVEKVRTEQNNNILAEEIQRLNVLLNEKMFQLEEFQTRATKAEQELLGKTGLETQVESLVAEAERLNRAISEKYQELSAWQDKYWALERANATLNKENEHVKQLMKGNKQDIQILMEKNQELENCKLSAARLEHQYHQTLAELEALKQKNLGLANDNGRLNTKIHDFEREISQVTELKSKLASRQMELENLTKENQRLINYAQSRDEVIADYIKKNSENEEKIVQLENIKGKLQAIVEENENLNDMIGKKVNSIQELASRVRFLEEKVENADKFEETANRLSSENKHLYTQLEQLRLEKLHNEKKMDLIKGYEERVETLLQENSKLRESLAGIERHDATQGVEIQQLHSLLNQKDAQIEVLKNDLEMYKKITDDKLKEQDELKKTIKRLEEANAGIPDLKASISLLVLENERQAKLKAEEPQDKLRLLAQENERVYQILQEKTSALEESRMKIKDLENRMKLGNVASRRSSFVIGESPLRDQNSLKKSFDADIERSMVKELQDKLRTVIVENERLNASLSEKNREINALRQQRYV